MAAVVCVYGAASPPASAASTRLQAAGEGEQLHPATSTRLQAAGEGEQLHPATSTRRLLVKESSSTRPPPPACRSSVRSNNYDPAINDSSINITQIHRQNCITHEPPLLWSSPGRYCHLWNPTNERESWGE
ncbi:hypothetical protein EYF80_052306 [Liparis tanakae]|uniref:Uncharacterized protein n=1 Tax=Liparis tanakae TaxID=230148 RepID=A0A4Z2F8G8_9TELE|nr:hypothetical protein EYF80_052306 [Liparis tanakae]